ncbi:hypothetical protein SXANM310S_07351 [Streptomyces xanthochromogenes]
MRNRTSLRGPRRELPPDCGAGLAGSVLIGGSGLSPRCRSPRPIVEAPVTSPTGASSVPPRVTARGRARRGGAASGQCRPRGSHGERPGVGSKGTRGHRSRCCFCGTAAARSRSGVAAAVRARRWAPLRTLLASTVLGGARRPAGDRPRLEARREDEGPEPRALPRAAPAAPSAGRTVSADPGAGGRGQPPEPVVHGSRASALAFTGHPRPGRGRRKRGISAGDRLSEAAAVAQLRGRGWGIVAVSKVPSMIAAAKSASRR